MNRSGFVNIAIILLVVVAIGVAGYFVFINKSQPQTPGAQSTSAQNSTKAKIAEINDLLSSAGIEELNDWNATSQCGPRDEFLGYVVIHPQKEVSFEQATKLKSMAMERRFNIDNWGEKLSPPRPSYSIMGNGWDIRVLALGDISTITGGVVKRGGRPEEHWYLTPNIPVSKPPADLPYSPLMCG